MLKVHYRRLDGVVRLLKEAGARRAADLRCGEGRLLQRRAILALESEPINRRP